jgi:hypothetical protein
MLAALIGLLAFLALLTAQALWWRRRKTDWFHDRPVLRGAVGGAEVAVICYLIFAATGDTRSGATIAVGTAVFVVAYAARAWAENEPERKRRD